jgi:hypothetical protein
MRRRRHTQRERDRESILRSDDFGIFSAALKRGVCYNDTHGMFSCFAGLLSRRGEFALYQPIRP